MHKKTWSTLGMVAIAWIGLGYLTIITQPTTEIRRFELEVEKPPTNQTIEVSQVQTENQEKIGREVLDQIVTCMRKEVPNPNQATQESVQAASLNCFMKVVMLSPDGKVRDDAEERLNAVIKLTGVPIPQPKQTGQASVLLQKLPNSSVFTLPVSINGKPQTFLLDTGASSSIIDTKTAQDLGIKGVPFPKQILKYFVVGNDCSKSEASIHALPDLTVDRATVSGLNGMGLPKVAIPGQQSGVLGMDFLSGYDLAIDPKASRLQLLPRSSSSIPTSIPSAIPLIGKLGIMTAEAKVDRKGSFKFALDSGADVVVLSERLAQKLGINLADLPELEVTGFCGTEKAKTTKLSQLELGGYVVKDLDVAIIKNDLLDIMGVQGIIGQNFLTRFQQYWRFGDRSALGFPVNGSLVLTPIATEK
ncbi:retropepsin-like aspartic protease [Tumidithrix elongata RA019]|uniref:Retropepsin-like aspartic protease n=1 Tax=Tumidithrix elongata BACA0141 TaxID=2716417 RepID=A0AAW9Q273_9CYAN|nr:retropepsin-like aspartic protease [Tumidithrix elongata RA019]